MFNLRDYIRNEHKGNLRFENLMVSRRQKLCDFLSPIMRYTCITIFCFSIPMKLPKMTTSQRYSPIPSIVVNKKKQSGDEAGSRVSELNDVDFFHSKENNYGYDSEKQVIQDLVKHFSCFLNYVETWAVSDLFL